MTRKRPSLLSTEQLLTSPHAFGIATASPAQRAICRVLDGVPLAELASHPDVLELIGGPDALAVLPSECGNAPTEAIVLAAIRSAKTIIACAAAIRATQTVDVSGLGPGEIPRVSLVSLKTDVTHVPYRMLLETLRGSPVLAPLLIDATADILTLRHPSGRPIEIAIVAGSKAGGGLVARWAAGVVFDEAPRMNGASDAVVNLDHARTAVLGRLLPGAQALYIGAAWAPHGPVYEMVQEHWRKPSERVVVLRGTGPMLNPTWWTPARCMRLQQQDPTAYQTDVMGEFADPESQLINPIAWRASTRELPLELEPERDGRYAAGVDLSDGTATGNATTLVITQHVSIKSEGGETRKRYRVALAREWRGLRPEQCLEQIAAQCKRYGLRSATADQFAGGANTDLARRFGLQLIIRPTTAASKVEDYTNFATLLHSGAVEVSPDATLRRDLLSVRRRTTQQGVSIVLPRSGDGRHADFAPSLIASVKAAGRSGAVDLVSDLADQLRYQRRNNIGRAWRG